MKTNSDIIILFIVLVGGIYCLFRGLGLQKVSKKRFIGILYVLMAICAFSFFLLALLGVIWMLTRSSAHLVLIIQAIISGMWLGLFLAKIAFDRIKDLE
jgi:hypothetical protein